MSPSQLNILRELQSDLFSIRNKISDEVTKVFDNKTNDLFTISANPKKDGEEIFRILDNIKVEFKSELKELFIKLDERLESL